MRRILAISSAIACAHITAVAWAQQAPGTPAAPDATPVAPAAAPPPAAPPPTAPPPAAPPVAAAPPPAPAVPLIPTAPPGQPVGNSPLESGPQPVMGKWGTTFYGFVEFDAINDSTQSFNDVAGNAAVQKEKTYAGDHHRTMFGVRNSRIGFKLNAPEVDGIKASAVLEMDFLGNQPTSTTNSGSTISEAAFWTNPGFRVRHMAVKVETPVVDMLFGQYWQLFGWQSYFDPNTVQIQGVPGEVFSRSPQARLSKTIKAGDAAVDLAIAASRPPQKDSAVPDGQAGIKFSYGGIKAVHTVGSAGTAADAAAVGVSGVMRRFILPNLAGQPVERKGITGSGISIDALVPIIPGTMEHRANALTFTGSWATGSGTADLYTGLTGGITFPNPTAADPAPTYPIDNGLVTYDLQGNLHTINWRSYILGVQYYLPVADGRLWLAGNYSRMKSTNALRYTNSAGDAKIFDRSQWYDVNLFFDMTKAVRFGGEYARTKTKYGDGHEPHNDRWQFSAFYIF
jgi:hypothetical protein